MARVLAITGHQGARSRCLLRWFADIAVHAYAFAVQHPPPMVACHVSCMWFAPSLPHTRLISARTHTLRHASVSLHRLQPVFPEFTFKVTHASSSLLQSVNAGLEAAAAADQGVCVCACVHGLAWLVCMVCRQGLRHSINI